MSSKASIENVFGSIGSIDAVICAAGLSHFGKLGEASDDDFLFSINNKLNACHHVMSRGRRGQDLFVDKADYQKFQDGLKYIENNILKSQTKT